MHRIDDDTRELNTHGIGKDGFTGGDGVTPGTIVTADWLNDVQESIAWCIEQAHIELDKGNDSQLDEAVRVRCADIALRNITALVDDPAGVGYFARKLRNGDWLVAGSAGAIETSQNGADWTARTADDAYAGIFTDGVSQTVLGIGYSTYETVLVGTGGEVQITTDNGATWTSYTISGAADLSAVDAGAGGDLITVGASGEIYTSDDYGRTWTARTAAVGYASLFNDVRMRLVDGGGTVAMAVGNSGMIQRSTDDGVTWQQVGAGVTTGALQGIAYFGGVWFAVASDGELLSSSDDGISWTSAMPEDFTSADTPIVLSIESNGTHLVACGSVARPVSGTRCAYWVSRDGVNWYRQVDAIGGFFGAGYNSARNQWLFCGANGGTEIYRASLRDWT
jgi:photosystem II stability/assembly factor-like uncharacterized protein